MSITETLPAAPTFPGTDLDLNVELNLGGAWTSIKQYIYENTTVITRGVADESTTSSPSSMTFTVDNTSGIFSSQNPYGAWYGKIGLNTECRASIPAGASYLRLEDSAWSGAKATFTSTQTAPLASGLDFQIDLTPDNWFAPQVIAGMWDSSAGYTWQFYTLPTGQLGFQVATSSGNIYQDSYVPLPFSPKQRATVRIVWNGSICQFYYAAPGGAGGTAPGWVLMGGVAMTLSATALTGARTMTIGGFLNQADTGNATYTAFQGKVHGWQLYNAADSSIIASTDFTAMTPGTSSWTDGQSNAWTLYGTAPEISNREYRFHGLISQWPQTWGLTSQDSRVAITANGPLRRVGQGNSPVTSPMFRAETTQTGYGVYPWAYWPCEDGQLATQISSGIPSGQPMIFPSGSYPTMASNSDFACSAALPVTTAGVVWNGHVQPYTMNAYGSNGADGIIRFLMVCPSAGASSSSTICSAFLAGGSIGEVQLQYTSGGGLALLGWDPNGNSLWSTTSVSFNVNGAPLWISIELRQTAASTFTASVVSLAPGATSGGQYTYATVTGTVGAIRQIEMSAPGASLTGIALGHITVQSTWSSLFNSAQPFNAWEGEAAGARFQRLCGEQGIAFRGMGNMSDTPAMGYQTIESFDNLLTECVVADTGIWFEPRNCLGFSYRTRASLGNRVYAFQLDYDQDHLDGLLQPTQDDQNFYNDITVTSQVTGSSAQATLNDGSPMSIGVAGDYDNEITVNTASDTQLIDQANWNLYVASANQMRYPTIATDLSNQLLTSDYQDYWYPIIAAEVGDRIGVMNTPMQLPPGEIDQIAMGMTETISRREFKISYNTRPVYQWNQAYTDDILYGHCDGGTMATTVGIPAGGATPTQVPNPVYVGEQGSTDVASTPVPAIVSTQPLVGPGTVLVYYDVANTTAQTVTLSDNLGSTYTLVASVMNSTSCQSFLYSTKIPAGVTFPTGTSWTISSTSGSVRADVIYVPGTAALTAYTTGSSGATAGQIATTATYTPSALDMNILFTGANASPTFTVTQTYWTNVDGVVTYPVVQNEVYYATGLTSPPAFTAALNPTSRYATSIMVCFATGGAGAASAWNTTSELLSLGTDAATIQQWRTPGGKILVNSTSAAATLGYWDVKTAEIPVPPGVTSITAVAYVTPLDTSQTIGVEINSGGVTYTEGTLITGTPGVQIAVWVTATVTPGSYYQVIVGCTTPLTTGTQMLVDSIYAGPTTTVSTSQTGWSTNTADYPLSINLGLPGSGEQFCAVSAASGVLTGIRGINQVTPAWAVGTSVQLFYPPTIGM